MTSRSFRMQAAMALLLLTPSAAGAVEAPITIERFGLFVATDDMERATRFYARLFGQPRVRVPGMVGFDVGSGLYAVVERSRFIPDAERGTTTRGYIKVADLPGTYELASSLPDGKVESGIKVEGGFSYFRLRDPDGNIIEFYSVAVR